MTIQQIRRHHRAMGGIFFEHGQYPAHPLRKQIECAPVYSHDGVFIVTSCKPIAHGKRFSLSSYDPATGKIEPCGKEHMFLTREGALGAIAKA